ncbi:MAG: hypothetical protein KGS72_26315 [Cyanobacteria bacterium REEB67]|nr:hypothetical protein [Cyanobacteria bacterium REEB67]
MSEPSKPEHEPTRRKCAASKKPEPATTPAAAPPNVVYEHHTLDGQRLRVVIEHAPGIDYFVVVERFEADKWTPIRRPLKETLFNPVNCTMEVAIMQLAMRLEAAEETIRKLQNGDVSP